MEHYRFSPSDNYKMASCPGSSCNNSDSSTTSQLRDSSEPGNSLVPTVSILDRLKPLTKSHLSRKRQVEKPSTSTKRHKTGTANSTDPKSVSPTKRVAEFPGECLSVRRGKLFCTACREKLVLNRSTVKRHIETGGKHKQAKE